MSSSASWANTRVATLWQITGRDDWNGVSTYDSPLLFTCDYKSEAVKMTDAMGVEFTTRQFFYTERVGIKYGDRLLVGEYSEPDPVIAGAYEVRSVKAYADTFEQTSEDYVIAT